MYNIGYVYLYLHFQELHFQKNHFKIFWDIIFEDHPATTFEKILIFTLLIFTLYKSHYQSILYILLYRKGDERRVEGSAGYFA